MDREKKHVYRHALLHANRFPHAHSYLDAYAEQHTASDLYSFADSNRAPHNYFNTHTYPASYVDGFPNTDPCDTKRYLDSLADAHTASNTRTFLNAHTHRNANALKTFGDFSHAIIFLWIFVRVSLLQL